MDFNYSWVDVVPDCSESQGFIFKKLKMVEEFLTVIVYPCSRFSLPHHSYWVSVPVLFKQTFRKWLCQFQSRWNPAFCALYCTWPIHCSLFPVKGWAWTLCCSCTGSGCSCVHGFCCCTESASCTGLHSARRHEREREPNLITQSKHLCLNNV